MTPKSLAYTPSVEDASEPPASEADSGDESLPPHTSEIGTLKKLPDHGTAWLGSSSGVYFVNTVRRAFSAALVDLNTNSSIPASEDILTGEGEDGRNYNGPVTDGPSLTDGDFRRGILAALGRPPTDRALTMELVTTFFRCWHPLFPFLHGPRFLQDVDFIYSMKNHDDPGTYTAQESRKTITFQLIINVASLDRSDLHLPVESRIQSTADVTRVAGCFAANHDIPAIQLLIAAELYLVATISLRQASTVAGMILKLIYHAGLHRCPLRYAQLSLEDCEIRKRIFWSAYALDRHLSLSLGDPNTVQDNDIDVCLSGRELHKAVAHELIINPNDELKMHLPRPQSGPHGSGSPSDDPRVVNLNDGPQAREKQQREAAMTAYVHYGKLTGQIIEIFHKSIHARFQKPDAITFLNSDIETWWNDLPSALTNEGEDDDDHASSRPHGKSGSSATSPNQNADQNETGQGSTPSTGNSAPTHKQLAPFFMILYQQLLLLLNRPRLSLDQSTAEFQHGLQICIKASRNSITALKKHRDYGQSMLLPGLLSAAWMAGLIIAFACQLGKYPKLRACQDIQACLVLLDSMGNSNWFTVKNCHKVLSLLLENIKSRKASANGFLATMSTGVQQQHQSQLYQYPGRSDSVSSVSGHTNNPRKRNIDDMPDSSPKRKSVSEASPASSADFRMPPPPNASLANPRTPTLGATTIPAGTAGTGATANLLHRPSSNPRNTNDLLNFSNNNTASGLSPSDWQATAANPSAATTRRTRSSGSNSPYMNTNTNPSRAAATGASSTNTDTMFPGASASGSALYADPQDMAYAQSSHTLNLSGLPSSASTAGNSLFPPTANTNTSSFNPTVSNLSAGGGAAGSTNIGIGMDDPMFWGNFDYNMSDIFGAASFENLSGGSGMVGDTSGFGMGMGMGMGMYGMGGMGGNSMGMDESSWGTSAGGGGGGGGGGVYGASNDAATTSTSAAGSAGTSAGTGRTRKGRGTGTRGS